MTSRPTHTGHTSAVQIHTAIYTPKPSPLSTRQKPASSRRCSLPIVSTIYIPIPPLTPSRPMRIREFPRTIRAIQGVLPRSYRRDQDAESNHLEPPLCATIGISTSSPHRLYTHLRQGCFSELASLPGSTVCSTCIRGKVRDSRLFTHSQTIAK